MIHPESVIQSRKGYGIYIDGKFVTRGKVLTRGKSWWKSCCQQVIRGEDGLRLLEKLRAIACVKSLLNRLEDWEESVYSFLRNGNNRIDAGFGFAKAFDFDCLSNQGAEFGYASKRSLESWRLNTGYPA